MHLRRKDEDRDLRAESFFLLSSFFLGLHLRHMEGGIFYLFAFVILNTQHKHTTEGAPVVAQQKRIWLASMRMRAGSLASLSELRIRHCCELWCRSQMWPGSYMAVAVAVAGGYSSDLNPSLETSICHGYGPKKTKKKKKKKGKQFFHISATWTCPRVPACGQKRSLGQLLPLDWKEGAEVRISPFASGENF